MEEEIENIHNLNLVTKLTHKTVIHLIMVIKLNIYVNLLNQIKLSSTFFTKKWIAYLIENIL